MSGVLGLEPTDHVELVVGLASMVGPKRVPALHPERKAGRHRRGQRKIFPQADRATPAMTFAVTLGP